MDCANGLASRPERRQALAHARENHHERLAIDRRFCPREGTNKTVKVPVWVLDADFEAPVRAGEIVVEDGQLRCDDGKGTISGAVPCEQLRQLLSRRYGDFLGQPFVLKVGAAMMFDCLLTSDSGSSMKFICISGPP
jgi:hypothetical protein